MGFDSITAKFHLPMALLWTLAYVCEFIGAVLGITLKLNMFNVRARSRGDCARDRVEKHGRSRETR